MNELQQFFWSNATVEVAKACHATAVGEMCCIFQDTGLEKLLVAEIIDNATINKICMTISVPYRILFSYILLQHIKQILLCILPLDNLTQILLIHKRSVI